TADAVPVVSVHLLVTGPPPAVEALATEAMKAMTGKFNTLVAAALVAVGLAGAGAATVWACGGYGPLLRPAPPVSEAKPYPFGSVETREAGAEAPAPAVGRPGSDRGAVGSDKPAGTDAGTAKPALFVMTNPARDITVVSDRHEAFVEFFRRQPVLVASVPKDVRDKLLYDAKGPVGFVFVDNASFNVDGPRVAAYGASVRLAPVTFEGSAFRLLEAIDARHPVVFVRDASNKDLWHAVGFTRRSSVGFFAVAERVKPDDFAPADLLHRERSKDKK
ncbi:MAG: hypothetical protein J0I06_02725, partial [Planctomycetes bacterium]|nr:hypothetical protein [Planctomycetota bacterium]